MTSTEKTKTTEELMIELMYLGWCIVGPGDVTQYEERMIEIDYILAMRNHQK